jgi:hypothetical protein
MAHLFQEIVNESSSSELDLVQLRFIKIQVESSRAELMKRFELKNLGSLLFELPRKLTHEPIHMY